MIRSLLWIAIAACFLRGLYVFDMGASALNTYPTASAICLVGSILCAIYLYRIEKIPFESSCAKTDLSPYTWLDFRNWCIMAIDLYLSNDPKYNAHDKLLDRRRLKLSNKDMYDIVCIIMDAIQEPVNFTKGKQSECLTRYRNVLKDANSSASVIVELQAIEKEY